MATALNVGQYGVFPHVYISQDGGIPRVCISHSAEIHLEDESPSCPREKLLAARNFIIALRKDGLSRDRTHFSLVATLNASNDPCLIFLVKLPQHMRVASSMASAMCGMQVELKVFYWLCVNHYLRLISAEEEKLGKEPFFMRAGPGQTHLEWRVREIYGSENFLPSDRQERMERRVGRVVSRLNYHGASHPKFNQGYKRVLIAIYRENMGTFHHNFDVEEMLSFREEMVSAIEEEKLHMDRERMLAFCMAFHYRLGGRSSVVPICMDPSIAQLFIYPMLRRREEGKLSSWVYDLEAEYLP